ncbi:MAG: 4Fe-4S binding protein, partial [Prevotella sp.]|nr:4Fe-4S binding protein [Prevotella sp.]
MLKKIRLLLAIVFWIGTTILFLDFTGTIHGWLGWMAKVQFVPAVLALNAVVIIALIVLTLLFGRIYCSVICPLGIMQDFFGWLGKKTKKNRYTYSPAKNILRYVMLGVFIIGLVTGFASIALLIEPYSIYGRIAHSILAPAWQWGNNILAEWAESANSYAFYEKEIWLKGMPVLIVAAASLIIIAILAW